MCKAGPKMKERGKAKEHQNKTTMKRKRDMERRTGSKTEDEVTEIWHDITTT